VCLKKKPFVAFASPFFFTNLENFERKNIIYVWELYIIENFIIVIEEVLRFLIFKGLEDMHSNSKP
jgi:Na+-transporting NADH:ubiquinone oxidoreductase subunit NqrD